MSSAVAVIVRVAEMLEKAAREHPEAVEHIGNLVGDILARRDPEEAASWHARTAAHSLATEKELDDEGVL